jgi:hypothetical protein
MTVKVGITATRNGMTMKQLRKLLSDARSLILKGHEIEFHHGDCIGGDAEGDEIMRRLGAKIHIHPPESPKFRAYCAQPGDTVYPEKRYHDRDHDIVDTVDIMYGGPKDHNKEEFRGSGTWATIRYTKKQMAKGMGPKKLHVLESY